MVATLGLIDRCVASDAPDRRFDLVRLEDELTDCLGMAVDLVTQS